jgi:hypothetical protein
MRKVVLNEETGEIGFRFPATVQELKETVFSLNNEKKTKYRNATIKFTDANGKEQITTARCFEGNYSKGIEKNGSYLCTARQYMDNDGKPRIAIQLSHLSDANYATTDMFGEFIADEVEENATVLVKK